MGRHRANPWQCCFHLYVPCIHGAGAHHSQVENELRTNVVMVLNLHLVLDYIPYLQKASSVVCQVHNNSHYRNQICVDTSILTTL